MRFLGANALKSVAILVSTVLFVAATAARADVHLFLAFMDDESNEVLRAMLEQHPDTPVVAIQAGTPNGTVFGKPHRTYSALSPHLVTTESPGTGTDLASRVASVLHGRLHSPEFTDRVRRGYVTGDARTVHGGQVDPELTVLTYGRADAGAKDIIVVAVSPEMGRQPGLVTPYLAEVAGALRTLPQAQSKKGGFHVSVIATSGGVHHKTRPGTISDVGASVFIGVEHAAKDGFDAVVAFEGGDGTPTIYFRKRFATRDEAEKAAAQEFLEKGGRLSGDGMTLQQRVLQERARGKDVSITASFFIGPEIKEKGDEIKLSNANMEDYHILKIAPLADSLRILRLVTDPPHIPDSLRDRIAAWSREPHFTLSTYEDAILWGLRGSPLDRVPDSARWTALDGASPSEIEGFLAPLPGKDPSFILSPFFAEIASEFLNELRKGTAFNAGTTPFPSAKGIISHSTTELLSAEALKELDALVAAKSASLSELAKGIVEAANHDASEVELRRLIRTLLERACNLDVPKGSLLYRELAEKVTTDIPKRNFLLVEGKIRFLAREPRLAEPGQPFPMETWVVNGRWDGNSGRHVRYLGKSGVNDTQQDRAFYRSGLLTLSRPTARREALAEVERVAKGSCVEAIKRAGLPK
jgi:hypothetical protein